MCGTLRKDWGGSNSTFRGIDHPTQIRGGGSSLRQLFKASVVHVDMYFGLTGSPLAVSEVAIVQDIFQNGSHKLIGSPYFDTTNGPPPGLFMQWMWYDPWTLY